MMHASIVRIVADGHGGSHFEDAVDALIGADFAPPAPPLGVSEERPARAARFVGAPAGWNSPPHAAPARQTVIIARGTVEVRTTDGAVRQFGPGTVVQLEDTTGAGHATRVLPGEDWVALVVAMA
jgi:quercetin dioxygenase-like cupin family protein